MGNKLKFDYVIKTLEHVFKDKPIGRRLIFTEYSYENSKSKGKVYCEKHGEFYSSYTHLRNGHGCKKCGFENHPGASLKYNTIDFIKDCLLIHGDNKFDYSKAIYKGQDYQVEIICIRHNKSFFQTAGQHKKGKICCPDCYYENNRISQTKTNEKFKEEAKAIINNNLSLDKTIYVNSKSKIIVTCNIHGDFPIFAQNILVGQGCPKCCTKGSNNYDNNIFIKRSKEVHGNRYDYNKINYVNNYTKIEILCSKHGAFWQIPHQHWKGGGCPKCSNSKGEEKIRVFLENNNIQFEYQKSFDNCRSNKTNRKLFFDFYMCDINFIIEFDGEQHFKPVRLKKMPLSNTIINFERIKNSDQIKNQYCKDNGINLLRIPYTDFTRIEKILSETLLFKNISA